MEREPVESSALARVGYDRDVLEVEFVNGSVYQYVGVPVWFYEALMTAQSRGRFFNEHIRNRYQYIRLPSR